MPYLLAIVIVAIAVVLGLFTGVWGGIVWLVAAAVVLAVVLATRSRHSELRTSNVEPTGKPRGGSAAPGSANERVGQS